MSLPIVWTPEAETTFQVQLDYLEAAWPEVTLRKFIDRVFEVIDHLEEQPEMYPVFRTQQLIHRCVINTLCDAILQNKRRPDRLAVILAKPSRPR